MRWIESDGGPLVLLPAGAAARWSGRAGPDYADLCDRCGSTWFVIVATADGTGLALCEPNRTGVHRVAADEVLLVQWIAADSSDAVISALASPSGLPWRRVGTPHIDGGRLVLFDSARSGSDLWPNDPSSARVEMPLRLLRVEEVELHDAQCQLYCLRLVVA